MRVVVHKPAVGQTDKINLIIQLFKKIKKIKRKAFLLLKFY
jgi:hypothetical protein